MKVRMKVDVSGSRDGKPWPGRGNVMEIPKSEAAQLCAAGMAEPVAEADEEPETAQEGAAETATSREDDVETADAPDGEQQGLTTKSAPAAAKKSAAKKTTPPATK